MNDKPFEVNRLTGFEELNRYLDGIEFSDLDEFGAMLCSAHEQAGFDAVQLLLDIDWPSLDQRQTMRWEKALAPIFLCLIISEDAMYKLYCQLSAAVGEGRRYSLNDAATKWLEANPCRAEGIVPSLLANSDGAALVPSCIQAIKTVDEEAAIRHLIDLSACPVIENRAQAIWAIGLFVMREKSLLGCAVDLLIERFASADEIEVINAVSAYFRFDADGESASLLDGISELYKSDNPKVHQALIWAWARNKGELKGQLKEETKQLMSRVAIDEHLTVDAIDHALYGLDVDIDREFIFACIESLFSQKECQFKLEHLGSTSHKLESANEEIIGWYAARFLLTGVPQLAELASGLFPPICQKLYGFDLTSLALEDRVIRFLVRKIFAYMLLDNGPAVSLLVACLKAIDGGQRSELCQEISDFWLYNYPGDIDFFQRLLAEEKALLGSIRKAHKELQVDMDLVSSLPKNTALRPSEKERRVQAEIEFQRNREIHKASFKGGFLEMVCQKSALLYGSASLTYFPTDIAGEAAKPQLMHLQPHSWSMKLPRMLKLSPAYIEYLLWVYKAEQVPDAIAN